MESLKSHFSLRSLDVPGRPTGTGRPSFLPPAEDNFARRLAQDLEEVQAEEVRARREQDRALTEERGSSRDTADARRSEENAGAAERTQEREATAGRDADRPEDRRRDADEPRSEDAEPAGSQREGTPETPAEHPTEPATAPDSTRTSTQHNAPSTGSVSPQLASSPQGGTSQGAGLPTPGAPGSAIPQASVPGESTLQPAGLPGTGAADSGAATGPALAEGRAAGTSSATGITTGLGASGAEQASNPRPASAVEGARTTAEAPRSTPPAADLERADTILRQVRLSLSPALRSATINLQPADLGRVTIRLRVQDDAVSAVLRAESPETLGVLERHVPELRAMLAQQGFEASEFDLGLAGDDGAAREGAERETNTACDPQGASQEEEPTDLSTLARHVAAAEGGVDYYA